MIDPITALQIQKKINRTQLAQQSGVPYNTLAAIASGRVGEIRYATAERLATYAGTTAVQIIETYQTYRRSLSTPSSTHETNQEVQYDIVKVFQELCDNRPQGMSKKQWMEQVAVGTGYRVGYIKNILLETAPLTQLARERLTEYFRECITNTE